MKKQTKYRHKKILVLGLAKSGVSAAKLLQKLDAFVTVNDYKPLSENQEAKGLLEEGIKVICGGHPIELLDEGFEYIVKNPGIPYTNPLVKGAIQRGIPVLTEVELAYEVSDAPIIGITGTNGKTTTTTLIFDMLKNAQQNPRIAGNIGTVAADVAQQVTQDETMVVELSSFQLMGIDSFKPHIAVMTNLYDAHLDYHGTRKEYAQAKANIALNQTEEDYLVLNADQPDLLDLFKESRAQKVWFSTERKLETGGYIFEGALYFNKEKIIDIVDIVVPGKHNLENILASICVCKIRSVENEAIISVLKQFSGVKHRTQFVLEHNGRKFYNDSKATNTLATKSALLAFDQPTILLAGGLDRGHSFDELIPYLSNVKAVITFGQTAKKWNQTAIKAGIQHVISVDNVESAVPEAYKHSSNGDIILLSPACASWDQYKTFEERGDMFIQAVHKL
ncbi:UDP-N-acetylmuramoyl-L-alanine--D-glutamate ligase [Bacillus spongiae]|uniref:UDP-N-acetylmuramoylalanine--D-glutamate ligase n=1 Tax=Bacillus spongiae TaxID=2683610 RepID=A0ABU8H9T1_9BACI